MSTLLIGYIKESVQRSGIYYLNGEIPVWSEDPLPEYINLRAVLDKIEQIDNVYVDATTNGLSYVVEKMKDQEISGHITLKKGERSKVATIAAAIL